MRKLIVLSLVVGAMFLVNSADAGIGQGPCHHGNSNKPCRQDPQPTHGKDCEHHGGNGKGSKANHTGNGQGNQDHCAGAVTPTPTPSEPTVSETQTSVPSASVEAKELTHPLAKTGSSIPALISFAAALLILGLAVRRVSNG